MSAYHQTEYIWGIDRRAINSQRSQYYFGRARWGDLLHPGYPNAFSVVPSDAFDMVSATQERPWVLTSAPFSTDNQGTTFPGGTVWVVALGSGTLGTIRPPGTVANPITLSTGPLTNDDMIYRAAGVPAGATGTLILRSNDGVGHIVNLSTLTIHGSDGAFQTVAFPTLTSAIPTEIYVSWSGGMPNVEKIGPALKAGAGSGTSIYWAVPNTLQNGYTARTASDTDRGGTFGYRYHADRTRGRAGPNQTYATLGLFQVNAQSPDISAGVPAILGLAATAVGFLGYNIWVGAQLRSLSWVPFCQGRSVYTATAAYVAVTGFTPAPGSITTFGFRAANLVMAYQKFSADPLAGDTVTVTIKQDGTTIYTTTLTGTAAIKAGGTVSLSVTLPNPGTSTVFQVNVSGTGTQGTMGALWSLGATLTGSPRCDIPFPFSCVGPGNVVAPGGYAPSALGTPTNLQPLTVLGSGVTTTSISSKSCIGFLLASSGWFRVTLAGVNQSGIGEDEFGWANPATIGRGRTGHVFYSKLAPSGSQTAALVAYVPTVTPINGSTLLTLSTAGHWAWASSPASGSGTYAISIAFNELAQVQCGLVIEVSGTDNTCVNYDQRVYVETYDEMHGYVNSTYKGTATTPPVSPTNGDFWAILPGATGAWQGMDNLAAVWDGYAGSWYFIVPRAGSFLTDGISTWIVFSGAAWVGVGVVAATINVTIVGGASLTMTVSSFAPERGTSGTVTITSVVKLAP